MKNCLTQLSLTLVDLERSIQGHDILYGAVTHGSFTLRHIYCVEPMVKGYEELFDTVVFDLG